MTHAESQVEGFELPLLPTKLYPPQLAPGLIPRSRQLQLLDRTLSHKVTLVSTPPGYGKSTLVAQWLDATPHPSAWINLDDADNDSVTFQRYLLAAIDRIDDSLTVETRRLIRAHHSLPVRAIIDSLVSELAAATRPFMLVFDDFHVIQAPELLEAMGRLVTYAPPALRLVLISRTDPRLPLMRMRARGELFELRAPNLAFTPEETRALLCDRYALPLDESQLAVLQSWSEGWPLGLVLVGQALQERGHHQISALIDRFAQNPDFIADYLWTELIQRQPEERQQFLLRTSILDQFNADVCDAVTGRGDAESMLASVAEANLFLIPLDERRFWYRYHHLFQDVLRERLIRTLPHDEILTLHSLAAHWYLSDGLVEEAATHAIKAEDGEFALQILTPICSELHRLERHSSLCAWLDQLPDEIIKRDPLLSYHYAWSLIRLGQGIRAREFFTAAEAQWRAEGNRAGIGRIQNMLALEDYLRHRNSQGIERCKLGLELLPDDYILDRTRTFALLGILHAQMGDLVEAEAALVQCRLLARQIGSLQFQLIEMNAYGQCLRARGDLSEAEMLYKRVIGMGNEWQDLPIVHAYALLGTLYLDQNRLDAAEQVLERALELADRLHARMHLIRVHRLLGELAWARQDAQTAMVELERSIDLGDSNTIGIEARYGRAQLAHIWMRQGKYNLARAWAAELGLNLDRPPEYAHVDEYLIALELLAHDGQTRRALASLDLAIELAQKHGHRHNLLHMLLLKCVLLAAQGTSKEASAALSSALDIAVAAGYVRPFLAFGSELEAKLQELSVTSTHARFIRHLLELLRRDRQQAESTEGTANPLSKRQTEIMQQVAAGYSNRDIADHLFISEQTVKKHLSTTFMRLGVSSRTQAIDACRRLNIL